MADPQKFDLDVAGAGGKIDLDSLSTSHPGNVVPKPAEQGSKHPTAAALVRSGAGLLSSLGNWEPGLGTLAAAGVGGTGETIAEMLDAGTLDPSVVDPKRVALEAGLSAIPGRAYFKVGSLAGSALKSGAIAGAGEYAREKVKGEEVSPKAVARATGIGAVTGGIFGRFLPETPGTLGPKTTEAGAVPVAAGPKPTIADLAAQHGAGLRAGQPGHDPEAFGKAVGELTRGMSMDEIAKEAANLPRSHANALRDAALNANAQWRGQILEKEIARLESLGLNEDAQHMRMASARTDTGTTKIYNRASNIQAQASKAQKAAEIAATRAEEARTRMEQLAESGKAKQSAQQTLRAVDPETGEIVSHTVRVTEKPPKKGAAVEAGGAEPPSGPRITPEDADVIAEVMGQRPREAVSGLPVAPEAPVAAVPEVTPEAVPQAPVAPPEAPKALVPEGQPARPGYEEPRLFKVGEPGTAEQVPGVGYGPPTAPPAEPFKAPEPLVSQAVSEATGVRGQPGKAKITDVLAGSEKAAIAEKVLRANYPKEFADQIVPLSQKYHELTDQITQLNLKARTPEDVALVAQLKKAKSALGVEMKHLTNQAEAAGVIPAGHGEATSAAIKDALENQNAEKFASQIPIAAAKPEPPSSTPIFPSDIPGGVPPIEIPPSAVGAMAAPRVPTGGAPAPLNLEGMNLQPNLEKAVESATQRAAGAQPGEGGTVLGSGFGGMQQLIEKHPELAKRLGMAGAGAIVGGLTDPFDDPVLSMAMGAGVGATAPDVLNSIKSAGIKPSEVPEVTKVMQSGTPEEKKNLGVQIIHLLPHLQRFNYLASVPGIGANAIAGPYGALFFGALERAIAGDPRGAAALREASPLSWMKQFQSGRKEALQMIERAEAGDPVVRAEIGGTGLLRWPFNRILQAPATAMASGDLASRTILRNAGFVEEEARDITATAPKMFIPTLRKLGNLARGEQSTFLSLIFPFVRTPLNLVEQGLIRTPGVGYGVQALRQSKGALQTSLRLQTTQQAIGGLMGFGGYALGTMTSPDDASLIRRFATNAAGPYSAIVALGFAMGQRAQGGTEPGVLPFVQSATQALPLPTTQTITEGGKALDKLLSGDVQDVTDLPSGMVPAFLRERTLGLGPEPPSPAMKKLEAKMKKVGTIKTKKFDLGNP